MKISGVEVDKVVKFMCLGSILEKNSGTEEDIDHIIV